MMEPGFYWYRTINKTKPPSRWGVCEVRGRGRGLYVNGVLHSEPVDHPGFVDFFGQHSQEVGCDYLTKYVEFGGKIEEPTA